MFNIVTSLIILAQKHILHCKEVDELFTKSETGIHWSY